MLDLAYCLFTTGGRPTYMFLEGSPHQMWVHFQNPNEISGSAFKIRIKILDPQLWNKNPLYASGYMHA